MPRLAIPLVVGLGLSACSAPEAPDSTRFAPSPVRAQAPGQTPSARAQGCWAHDPDLGLWIQTPCAEQLSEGFVASLERALSARGFYASGVTGEVTPALRAAIRAYQGPLGLNSAVLSLGAAERLGLMPVSGAQVESAVAPDPTPLPTGPKDPRVGSDLY